jgi:hypothetical protein
MKNHKFNVVTSGLTAYVDENDTQLLTQLQMESELAPYAEVRSGVKGTERMHFMTTTATFQTDACSYSASDTTTFTEKDVTVGKIAIMEDICPKLLQGFWAQQVLAAGSRGEEAIPSEIAQAWTAKKLNLVRKQINVADWQGNTASGSANLNKYDGLLLEIFADGSVVDGNTSDASTATSVSNILARMQEMYLAVPEDLRGGAPDGGGLVWFLPQAYYDFYVIALREANLFHFKGEERELRYYGTDITLVPQVGLASQDKMVITTRDNIVIAVDMESDEDTFEVWYSKDDRINHSLIAFKRGITYKYSDYIVKWGLGTS